MVRFLNAGDRSLTVEFGNEIKEEIHRQVMALDARLSAAALPGIVETVPTYRSLTVLFDPAVLRRAALERAIEAMTADAQAEETSSRTVLEIPVLYGGEAGPDLAFVAEHAGMTEEEVIRRHSETEYRIYMLGFLPGFTYLGGMDEAIAAPRLEKPRTKIPAGSVGIAGTQTGVYPLESPGGWRLIGRTPAKLYDPSREEPILTRAGDYIRFRPITAEEFARLEAAAEAGESVTVRREEAEHGHSN